MQKIYRSSIEIILVSLSLLAFLFLFQSKGLDTGILELGTWRYVHIGDASENIKNSFFLAKGAKLNEYVTSNHMPGLYVYLSLFLSVLPNDLLNNSVSNAIFIISFSNFVTILTAVGLCFFAINLLVKDITAKVILKLIFSLILLHLYVSFSYYRVLSETYLPFIQFAYLSLFYFYLLDSNKRFSYLVSGIYLICISIFFGLTNVFTDLIFLGFYSVFFIKDIKKVRIVHFLPGFVLLTFILIKSNNLDFHYWIIETNKAQGFGSGLELLRNILGNALHWTNSWYQPTAFGPIYDHQFYVILLGVFCIYLSRKSLVSVLFFIICLIILPLDSWRIKEEGFALVSQTYKTDVNMGVCFFFLLVGFRHFEHRFQKVSELIIGKLSFELNPYLKRFILVFIVLLLGFRILAYLINYIEFERKVVMDHSTWIAQENLCKQKFVKPNLNCSCLSIMYWDQDFFLINNVRPCANQFSSYSPHLNSDDTYFKTVESSFLRNESIFLLNHTDLYTDKSILSDRLVQLFRSGECKSVHNNLLYLCKSRN